MNRRFDTLKETILFEMCVQRRNPIWIISVAAAALLGFSEAYTLGVIDWPTANQAFRAYQLGTVVLFGVMSFLLTAGSLSRDLSDGKRDLFLCRPVSLPIYICGKYLGNVFFVLCINILFMLSFLVIPLFYGQSSIYPLRSFLQVMFFSTLPTILFCSALAVFFVCLTRKAIVAVPAFLVYFLAAALFRIPASIRGKTLDVDMWDFSMRLYPRSLTANVGPCRLVDESFSHLLEPPVPELYARAGLYCGLSLVLVALSVMLLRRMRNR